MAFLTIKITSFFLEIINISYFTQNKLFNLDNFITYIYNICLFVALKNRLGLSDLTSNFGKRLHRKNKKKKTNLYEIFYVKMLFGNMIYIWKVKVLNNINPIAKKSIKTCFKIYFSPKYLKINTLNAWN